MFDLQSEVDKAKEDSDYIIQIPDDYTFREKEHKIFRQLRKNGYLIRDHKLVPYDGDYLAVIDEGLLKLCSGNSYVFSGLTISFDGFSVMLYVSHMLNILNFNIDDNPYFYEQMDFNKYIKVLEEHYTVEKLDCIGKVAVRVY